MTRGTGYFSRIWIKQVAGLKKMKTLFALLLFLTLSTVEVRAQNHFNIEQQEFEFAKTFASYIKTNFPSDQYYYVGVGRSPTLLIAYLKLSDPGSAGFLPATGVKWAPDVKMYTSDEYVQQGEKEAFQRHFARFLPSLNELKGRKLLLIDHVQSGVGLRRVKQYINALVELPHPAEDLALVFKGNTHRPQSDHSFLYENENQHLLFASEKYDKMAPYTEAYFYEPEKLQEVRENPNYLLLVKLLKSQMSPGPHACSGLLQGK